MSAFEVTLLIVTFASPIAAVQAQKWIERYRDKKRGKDHIFRTLMATRAARVSADHVRALNMIDLEFYGGGAKEKKVREVWRQYLHHLDTPFSKELERTWEIKRDELFVELLYEMATCVGYDFDKTHIQTTSYSPVAHGNLEQELMHIRQGLVALLAGQSSIGVRLATPSEEDARIQAEIQKLLLDHLRGNCTYRVAFTPDDGQKES